MSRSRSPNYPSLNLGEAIEAIRKVFAVERRAKFPRLSLASHLGYSSLNGRALAKIGALRAYGLIEGREDTLSVSDVALAILEAPKDSEDYLHALHEAFNAPPLFQRILEEHGDDTPSDQTLRWWLSKQGYVGEAADRAMQSYLASAELVNSAGPVYSAVTPEPVVPVRAQRSDRLRAAAEGYPGGRDNKLRAAAEGKPPQEGLSMGVHERVLQSGMLSKAASYRVIVSGPVGEAELERLIAKLEMDKEILADTDPQAGAPDDEDRDPRA